MSRTSYAALDQTETKQYKKVEKTRSFQCFYCEINLTYSKKFVPQMIIIITSTTGCVENKFRIIYIVFIH